MSLAKRKRVDSGEQEEPVSKPAASTDSETSDSDDEVRALTVLHVAFQYLPVLMEFKCIGQFCSYRDFNGGKFDFVFSLSSGLSVAQKVKRRSSQAKAQRRRMPQRRSSIKQRRPAARMETAQRRARPQRRVRGPETSRHHKVLTFQFHTNSWHSCGLGAVWLGMSSGLDYTHNQDSLNH